MTDLFANNFSFVYLTIFDYFFFFIFYQLQERRNLEENEVQADNGRIISDKRMDV